MIYKNCGLCEKTYYGVTFKPGAICEVPGYITSKWFIRVTEDELIRFKSKQTKEVKQESKRVGRPAKVSKQDEVVEEDKTKQPGSSSNLEEDKTNDDQSKE